MVSVSQLLHAPTARGRSRNYCFRRRSLYWDKKKATGSFKLPLGVMQEQLHTVWNVPTQNLQPPD
jgi:hypothetical protein